MCTCGGGEPGGQSLGQPSWTTGSNPVKPSTVSTSTARPSKSFPTGSDSVDRLPDLDPIDDPIDGNRLPDLTPSTVYRI